MPGDVFVIPGHAALIDSVTNDSKQSRKIANLKNIKLIKATHGNDPDYGGFGCVINTWDVDL